MLFIWDRDNIHFIMLDFKEETYISRAVHDQNSNTNTSCDQSQLIRGRLGITKSLQAGFFFSFFSSPPPPQPTSNTQTKFIIQRSSMKMPALQASSETDIRICWDLR